MIQKFITYIKSTFTIILLIRTKKMKNKNWQDFHTLSKQNTFKVNKYKILIKSTFCSLLHSQPVCENRY